MSTSRYTNTGRPGTSTVIDNMASRVKAWASVAQQTATPTLGKNFNVASLLDGGVGQTTCYFTALMTGSAVTAGTTWVNTGGYSKANFNGGSTGMNTYVVNSSTGALVDEYNVQVLALGDMA